MIPVPFSSNSMLFKTVIAALAFVLFVSRAAPLILAAPPTNNQSVGALPPDLPLPASPPLQEKWLREANILQPYGHSAFVALTDRKDRPARLKKEFGFNAIIVQPPDSHNTIAAAADKLSEKQFTDGIAAYRAAGYRILLYTSVMALGLSPEFQSGQISREHPDWLQRDPKGNPVLVWGVPWLCPSTGAREAALERCLRIVKEYNADGVMLDNNQFFFATAGWTCHCDSCANGFRDYIHQRFGDQQSTQLFGAPPEKLQIPTDEGPLYFNWLHWRNRVWAEVNESFRAQLRKQNPRAMLFANTQYLYENGMLASDSQFEREDVVLSESCGLTSRQASRKMFLGQALAAGRPLWNYIGTFAKADDYTGLLPPETIGPAIAVTLAHNARPWIVDGFDEGPTNADSHKLMSKLLSWHAGHPALFTGEPCSRVAAIVSTQSRNVLHSPLTPPHVDALQAAGVSPIGLRDEMLTLNRLRRLDVITIESAGCLPSDSAKALAAWVREGGTLVAAPDTGAYDELGRKRLKSTLWEALTTLGVAPAREVTLGRGRVVAPNAKEFATTAVRIAQPHSFIESSASGAEVVAYRTANSLLLHIIRHDQPGEPISLRLPKSFAATSPAKLFTPGSNDSLSLPLTVGSDGASLKLPNSPQYCVVEIALK